MSGVGGEVSGVGGEVSGVGGKVSGAGGEVSGVGGEVSGVGRMGRGIPFDVHAHYRIGYNCLRMYNNMYLLVLLDKCCSGILYLYKACYLSQLVRCSAEASSFPLSLPPGLLTQGIYRKNPSPSNKLALKEALDKGR